MVVWKNGKHAAKCTQSKASEQTEIARPPRDVIRGKRFSIRTERSYVDWIRRFILFHDKRHPRDTAEGELTQFLTHLARDGRVALQPRIRR
jgi:hypothetical protein